MIVRPARTGDAAALAAIWNPVIEGTAATFTTVLKTPEGIAADIAARGACFQVLELDGVPAGLATCFPFRAGPGYAHSCEHSVILAPEARGRGGGRALMEALMAAARAEGQHVMVAAISGENPGAVRFHARLGFEERGRLPQAGRKFGRWMDLILMQKILDARA